MEEKKLRNLYDNETIDLLELARALLRNWWRILIPMVVVAILAAGYNMLFMPHQYKAEASIYITNPTEEARNNISYSDIQISNALAKDYEAIIKSRPVLDKVMENLGITVDYKTLKKMISVTNPSDTHIISIAVTCRNRNDSVIITNELVQISVKEIYRIIGTKEPAIIYEASDEFVENVKASMFKYAAIGALAAFVIVAAIIIIRTLLDTTIKNEDDIEKYVGLPVLATVPMNRTSKDQVKTKNNRSKKERK